ncbi:MAG: hypothetical protein ACTSYL_00040 [Candidatus Thorarchaeota archaeon]
MVKNWFIIQGSKLKKFTSEKILSLTATKLNELLIENLTEMAGEDETILRVFKGGMKLGNEFMMELSAHLINDIETVPAYGEAAWILFAGKAPTWQKWEKTEFDGHKAWIYRWADDDCSFCRNIQFPRKFCAFPAGAFQGAAQTWSALMNDGAYHVLSREVKCKAQGADACEYVLVLVEKETPLEVLKEHMPELFEDIQLGFVDY